MKVVEVPKVCHLKVKAKDRKRKQFFILKLYLHYLTVTTVKYIAQEIGKSAIIYTLLYMLYYRLSGMNLMYVHDDTETLEDSFTIQLTDGKHQIQQSVTVQIVPQNDEEPSVIRWDFEWRSCWSMFEFHTFDALKWMSFWSFLKEQRTGGGTGSS